MRSKKLTRITAVLTGLVVGLSGCAAPPFNSVGGSELRARPSWTGGVRPLEYEGHPARC
jgi:hypothetical protein